MSEQVPGISTLPPAQEAAAECGSEAEACSPSSGMSHNMRIRELFEAHNRSLVRFLSWRLHSSQDAKEVAQEAYVRMLQLDSPNGISYLRAFLFKTASNLATDRLKSAARRMRAARLDFFDAADYEPPPEAAVSAEQQLATILKACESLPARCRYAFVMHRFYGHSISEVAALMNLSVRMVQLYVRRALVFCRDRLMEQDEKRS